MQSKSRALLSPLGLRYSLQINMVEFQQEPLPGKSIYLDFKDVATSILVVVMDFLIFNENTFLAFNRPLIQFLKTFSVFRYHFR